MLKAIFTLDYEIHGNGEGCPQDLMVEPTARMLDLFDKYGAKLTIMADVAEISKFKEYKEQTGRDDYYYDAIADQLRGAVRRGHDVQLHLHTSYFNARHESGRWLQDWSEYDFARLPFERLNELVRTGKNYLEDLLKSESPEYKCIAFRAANWAVSPSQNIARALQNNGIRIDTSVFKYGWRCDDNSFDYSNAYSDLVPWAVDENDICARSENGELLEFPIYAENRWVVSFLTLQRIYRAFISASHKLPNPNRHTSVHDSRGTVPGINGKQESYWLTRRHAWKADLNQCSGRQLVRALRRAEIAHAHSSVDLPFVVIGHSKLFTRFNEWSLRSFLSFIASKSTRFGFATFGDFDLLGLRASYSVVEDGQLN